jgi:hypothetical protein
MVSYCGKKPIISRVKIPRQFLVVLQLFTIFQGKFNVTNIPMVIYHHSTVITKLMLLYNME